MSTPPSSPSTTSTRTLATSRQSKRATILNPYIIFDNGFNTTGNNQLFYFTTEKHNFDNFLTLQFNLSPQSLYILYDQMKIIFYNKIINDTQISLTNSELYDKTSSTCTTFPWTTRQWTTIATNGFYDMPLGYSIAINGMTTDIQLTRSSTTKSSTSRS